ncbi:MAG: diadenylate cyclase CdaA [Clostridia bacterium]|nr:diadenylate cyclase CdaA [Clostridia bacterium]
MGSFWNAIYSFWNYIVYAVSNMRMPYDIIDILVIAFIIYKAIGFLRETRAGQLIKGIAVLLIVYIISDWLDLAVLEWTLSRVMNSAIIAAAVIFQPELRRILERVGRTGFRPGQLLDGEEDATVTCIDHVTRAAGKMQEKKIGALIVFERKTQLGEIINTGTVLDAKSSLSVISNIFFPKSPLHDGAVIIRDGRVYAAGCILPLTQRDDINSQLGTRHRAAIGMTENSDAVVLVVSEETGIISIVSNGQINRGFNSMSASAELSRLLLSIEKKEKESLLTKISNKVKDIFKINKGKENR